jgi:hypothetical protein
MSMLEEKLGNISIILSLYLILKWISINHLFDFLEFLTFSLKKLAHVRWIPEDVDITLSSLIMMPSSLLAVS